MFSRHTINLIFGVLLAASLTAAALVIITTNQPARAEGAQHNSKAAPQFTGTTAKGETISLADFEGKTVVLEWTNNGCPFVQKHYMTGNMQALQQKALEEGIIWLSVISSAPGKQGHVNGAEAQTIAELAEAVPHDIILDPSGNIGRLYEAKTTPHMYVINGDQELVYRGAIDNKRRADPNTIKTADNYVLAALKALGDGLLPDPAVTKPYGCSVKY